MDYKPFEDYFGLSNLAWQSDLVSNLNEIMEPHVCSLSPDDSMSINVDLAGFTSFDPMDLLRTDAHEEFRSNGVDADLDELDMYQSRLRERSSVRTVVEPRPAPSVQSDNSALSDYLALKDRRQKKSKKACVFCKNNGEAPKVYQTHVVKDADGRVTCPVLRRYTCPICGVSGDDAHTIRYCPMNEDNRQGFCLLKTSRLSNGRLRRL